MVKTKISLNQNTCQDLQLFDFIARARKFDGVELEFEKLKGTVNGNSSIKDVKELLEVYDLEASSIYSLKDFSLCSERDFKTKIIPTFVQMLEYCYKLECNLLIVSPSSLDAFSTGSPIPQERILKKTTNRLKNLSKEAKKSDIKIGFEYCTSSNCSIMTLYDAKDILKPLETRENVGYIIDTFLFAKSNENLDQLRDINEQIWLIQLSDIKDVTLDEISKQEELKRIFPGEGVFKWREFIALLQKLRYRGKYSLELLEKECPKKMYEKIYSFINGLISDYWRAY